MLCTFLYHFNYYTIHHAVGERLSGPTPTHCSCIHTICSNVVFPSTFIHSSKLCSKLPVNDVMATLTLQQLQHWLSAFNMCGSWECWILRIGGRMLCTGSSFLLMWWCYWVNTDTRDWKLTPMYMMYRGICIKEGWWISQFIKLGHTGDSISCSWMQNETIKWVEFSFMAQFVKHSLMTECRLY